MWSSESASTTNADCNGTLSRTVMSSAHAVMDTQIDVTLCHAPAVYLTLATAITRPQVSRVDSTVERFSMQRSTTKLKLRR